MAHGNSKFASFSVFFKLASQAPSVTDPLLLSSVKKVTHPICITLRNITWLKLGVTPVHPAAMPLAVVT